MLNVTYDEQTGKYVFSLAYTAVKKVKVVAASSAIAKPETTYTVVKNAGEETGAAQKTQNDVFSDYFSAKDGARFELVDDRENKKSFAAVESLEWFSKIMSRKDAFAYLEDLSLAALYLKVAGTSGGHSWLTENDANPDLNNAYGAGDIPLGDKRMHGMDLRGIYHDGRMKILEDAYNKIISKNNDADLARYILYRDTALSPIDWNAFEMNAVKIKSMDIVQSKIKDAASHESVMGIVTGSLAAGYMWLSVPTMVLSKTLGLGLLAKGILCTAVAIFHADTARDLTDLKNDIAKNQSGVAANQNALKSTVSADFAAFAQKAQNLKKLQEELTLYRGEVGDDEELEFSAFSKSITAILTGAKGVVRADEWQNYYTKDTFKKSGCENAKSTSEAIAMLNTFLKETQDASFQTAAENKIALKAEQYDALESFTKTVNQSFVIAPNDAAALRESALKAGNINLSIAARAQASREYDALAAKYSSPDALAQLSALLQRDAETAFKNIAHNGSSWLESGSDSKIIAIREKLFDTRTDYSRGTEDYMQELLQDAKQQMLFAFDHAVDSERTAKRTESAIAQKQFVSRLYDWNNNMQNVLQNAEAQWSAAEEKINSEFRIWQENFAAEYTARTGEWQKNYNEFLHSKDEWMTEQYVAASTRRLNPQAGKPDASGKTGADELLQKLLASSPKLVQSENAFDSTVYVENLIAQSGVRELLAYSASLNGGIKGSAGLTKRGTVTQSGNQAASMLAAEKTLHAISAERKTAAGKIAAERARIQLEYTISSYKDRLKAENESMKKWETELMQEYGYTVSSNTISRNQIVYSTVFSNIREKQTVHMYEFFVASNIPVSSNLDQAALLGFNDYEIMLTVASEQQALVDWSTDIFGKADKYGRPEEQDVGESRKLRDGRLGKHIGYKPVLKDGADIDTKKDKTRNIKNAGLGQMGIIMLDFQWNSIIAGQGYASLGTPAYDKAMWDDRNSDFKSPTLRSAVDMAFSIIGKFTGGAIGFLDDLLFAGLDLSYGYKTPEEIGKMLAKAAVGEVASFAGAKLGKLAEASKHLNKAGGNSCESRCCSCDNVYCKSCKQLYRRCKFFRRLVGLEKSNR